MNTFYPVQLLSNSFSTILRQELSVDEMEEVVKLNKTPDYTQACATHNFCDANESMIAAFIKVFNRDIDFSSDNDTATMDAAWNLSRENNFKLL
jgi:hypothetical protein